MSALGQQQTKRYHRAMSALVPKADSKSLLLPFAGNDIGPQRLDVGRLKQITPRRHVVFAFAHRIGEARILLGRKRAQIETASRIVHAWPMTRHAIGRVDIRAPVDLLLRELRLLRLLRSGARADEHEAEAENIEGFHFFLRPSDYSGINANVDTEPPLGTLSAA